MSKPRTARSRLHRHSSTPRPGRMSRWQEMTLFIFLMLVLLALIYVGIRA